MDEYSIKESQYVDAKPVAAIVDDQAVIIASEEEPVEVIESISPSSQIVKQEGEHLDEPRTMTYDEIATLIRNNRDKLEVVRNLDNSATIRTKPEIGEPSVQIKFDGSIFSDNDMTISAPSQDTQDITTAKIIMEHAQQETMAPHTKIIDNNQVIFDENERVIDVTPIETEDDMKQSPKTM